MGSLHSTPLRERVDSVRSLAHGKWPAILERLHVPAELLDRKGHPCPKCKAGTDRFCFSDKFHNGDYHCRHCGHGDGFELAMAVLGEPFVEILKRVEEIVGSSVPLATADRRAPSADFMRALARQIWVESVPVQSGDDVDRYLSGRGLRLSKYPDTLRRHPGLKYFERNPGEKKARAVASYPAMVCPMVGRDGNPVTIHRTYLSNGRKANVPDAKKVLNSFSDGPAIRLFEPTDTLAITEGIETALAVHIATGHPVWAAYSATNLQKIWLPESVRRVCIYGDNDANFVGQAAAYALASRLRSTSTSPPEVLVHIPRSVGDDWADVIVRRQALSGVA